MIGMDAGTNAQETFIDLRSDTTTQPTAAMREAMFRAEVGDDTLGDDPTVRELEALAADMCGMEAGLLCPSGMMANGLALRLLTRPGDRVLCMQQHMVGSGLLGMTSLTPSFLPVEDGHLVLSEVSEAIARASRLTHSALCVENTHNGSGGTVMSVEEMNTVAGLAENKGLPLYLDGARVFNAAVALDVPASELVSPAVLAMFCLSKGLSAPVGSMLVGRGDLIDRARELRHLLGGSMRQAGIIAAAGIVALKEMVTRLDVDHANAAKLAAGLGSLPCVELENPSHIDTNIVFFKAKPPWTNKGLVSKLAEKQVLMLVLGTRIRAVTHRHICEKDVNTLVETLKEIVHDERPA